MPQRHDELCGEIAAAAGIACGCSIAYKVRDNERKRRPHSPGYVLEIDRWFCVNCEKPWPCPVSEQVTSEYQRSATGEK